MENQTLSHWGIKGMRWGVRRYQNKDGSLTSLGKKRRGQDEGKDSKKNPKDAKSRFSLAGRKQRKLAEQEMDEKKSIEERRAKLLKSTDADELYKNRDILSTNEINERLIRIDTERRLNDAANRNKKSGMDYVDKVLKYGRKADEAYKFMTESSIGKALKKKLFGEVELPKDLETIWNNRDKIPTKDLQEALKRARTEDGINKIRNERKEAAAKEADAAKKEAQRQVDDYNTRRQEDEARKYSTYHQRYPRPEHHPSSTSSDSNSSPKLLGSGKTKDNVDIIGPDDYTIIEPTKSYNSGRDYVNNNRSSVINLNSDQYRDVDSEPIRQLGESFVSNYLPERIKD